MPSPISNAFSKQREKYTALSSEDVASASAHQAATYIKLRKASTQSIIIEMAKGFRNQQGHKILACGGRPPKLHLEGGHAFNGCVYAPVALNLFHWDNSTDTGLKFYKRDMKSYFTHHAPFAGFTSAPFTFNAVSKRKSRSSSATEQRKRINVMWSADSKVIAVEVWLGKIKRINVAATSKQAFACIRATILYLHQHHPSTFSKLKQAHLHTWVQKYINHNCNIDVLKFDGRIISNSSGSHARVVPLIVLKGIDSLIMTLIASKCELNATILRPFIIKFVKTFDDGMYSYLIDNDCFKCSPQWIRNMLRRLNQSYRSITNDAGKLPDSWQEDRDAMLVRVGYIVYKHNIRPELLLNMDETPLMMTPSSGKTWAQKGSSNVFSFGSKDKRQIMGTPWINYNGDIVLFHTTVRGKTERSLPKPVFRNEQKFKEPVPFGFSVSPNHWVSKDTMREQVTFIENYRVRMCFTNGWEHDSKLLILWDVYVRHRDQDLVVWMRITFPNIIVLFIPANLTEICQPLDRYFNALMKTILYTLRNTQNAEQVFDLVMSRGGTYKHPTKLSEVREPFFTNLSLALEQLQTPERKKSISDNCWKKGMFEMCYDCEFQRRCVQLVGDDVGVGKYFSTNFVDPALTKDRRQIFVVADDFLDSLSEQANLTLEIAQGLKKSDLVGRKVVPLNGVCPGYVLSYNKKTDIFWLRYYRVGLEKSRAKKKEKVNYLQLLTMLLYSDPGDADDNDVEYAVVDEAEENTDITDENNNSDYSDEEDEVEYY